MTFDEAGEAVCVASISNPVIIRVCIGEITNYGIGKVKKPETMCGSRNG
jgi:hypothetical protein